MQAGSIVFAVAHNSRRTDSTIAVVHALLAQGAIGSKYENIAQVTRLSRRTVATVMGDLRKRALVANGPKRLGPAWGGVVSVALGTESCRAGWIDANGQLFEETEHEPLPEQTKQPPSMLLQRISHITWDVLNRAKRNPKLLHDGHLPVIGLATAWPSPVRGSMRTAGTILHPDWAKHDQPTLPAAVAQAVNFPPERTHALNDANAHAMAVVFDRARERALDRDDNAGRIELIIRLGGKLGAATMIGAEHRRARLSFIDSSLLGGARNLAGELAHLPVDQAVVEELNDRSSWSDGLAPLSMSWTCSCGQTGHLGALATGTAWFRRMAASGIPVEPLHEGVLRGAVSETGATLDRVKDPRMVYALEDIGRLIGRALTAPTLLLDPHSITLTGSFAVEQVRKGLETEQEMLRHVFGDAVSVQTAARDQPHRYLGVRGAALAVIRRHIYRRLDEHLTTDRPLDQLTFSM